MSNVIPKEFLDLFEKKGFAHFATLMADGSPQVTPVWCNYQDELVWINSAVGRQKDRNIKRDPRVALSIQDPDNPYRYLEVRGKVVEITEDGADDHIDALAKKYMGVDRYPLRTPEEKRVIYKIQPENQSSMNVG